MPLLLFLALATQSAPVGRTLAPSLNLDDPVDCTATPGALACRKGPARYRLPADDERPFDRKADGLQQDGRQCGLIGPKVCTRKPRTILSTAPRE